MAVGHLATHDVAGPLGAVDHGTGHEGRADYRVDYRVADLLCRGALDRGYGAVDVAYVVQNAEAPHRVVGMGAGPGAV